MRLIRLMAYVALGYFIYEIYQGLAHGAGGGGRGEVGGAPQRARSRPLARALDEDTGRMNITGTGRGQTISVEGGGGAVSHHTVGRGVTPE